MPRSLLYTAASCGTAAACVVQHPQHPWGGSKQLRGLYGTGSCALYWPPKTPTRHAIGPQRLLEASAECWNPSTPTRLPPHGTALPLTTRQSQQPTPTANLIHMERSHMLLLSILCALALTASARDMMTPGAQPPAPVSTDIAVMQFALNLEYLEANFYSCAAYGTPLKNSLSGKGPTPLGCKKALLSPAAQYYAESIAQDELKHVTLLRTALGANAFPQPLLDIGMAFQVAANVALNTTLSPPFSAYGDDALFYHAAFIFEDVGVTAYSGALPLISKGLLPTAAGIMAVEAYHGGSIRTLLLAMQDQTIFPYGAEVKDIIAAISALRGAVGGGKDAGLVASSNGAYIIAPADANAVAFSRTTTEVLAIVYLGGKTKGGFFPNGLNGTITM